MRSSRPPRFSSRENSTPATADHGVHRHHASPGLRGRVDLPSPAQPGRAGRRQDLPGLEGARPAGRCPDHLRRGPSRCPAGRAHQLGRAADAGELVRAAQDDRAAAPRWPGRCALHPGPAHARAGHARRAPGKQPRTTTSSTDTAARAGDLLDRDFTAPAPNRVWIADFTYVRTWAAMVYVAFVVDVDAQRIVGWHTMSTP